MGFSIKEFRDFDILLRLRDTGPIKSKELATELGADEELGRFLGRRLGWMHHYGMLDRDPKTTNWSLTEAAQRVIFARKRARLIEELGSLPEEELIEVMAQIMARYRLGQPMIATMLRREFTFGTRP